MELCARMNYETENLDIIDQLPKGAVMFDLGACEGRFSIYAGLRGVKVFSFEPEKRNFATLEQNVHLNQQNFELSVSLYNVGVGKEKGVLKMGVGQPWAGGHQKVVQNEFGRSDLNFEFSEIQEVKIIALDQFMEEEGLPLPTYLKVDIDGSEMSFLEGAKKTLSRAEVEILLFELDTQDQYFREMLFLIEGFGFKEINKHQIPNEPHLFNFEFRKSVVE